MYRFFRVAKDVFKRDVDLLRPQRDVEQEAEQVEQQVLNIVQYCFAL